MASFSIIEAFQLNSSWSLLGFIKSACLDVLNNWVYFLKKLSNCSVKLCWQQILSVYWWISEAQGGETLEESSQVDYSHTVSVCLQLLRTLLIKGAPYHHGLKQARCWPFGCLNCFVAIKNTNKRLGASVKEQRKSHKTSLNKDSIYDTISKHLQQQLQETLQRHTSAFLG